MAEDRYANIATMQVPMTAANTLTFADLETGMGIRAGRQAADAMLIDEIDYFIPKGAIEDMTTAGDSINLALCVSDGVTSLADFTDRRILNFIQLSRADFGTAGNARISIMPVVRQFFPPLVVGERKIFLGADSGGLASAFTPSARIYYRTVELTQGELLEISEIFRLVS